MNTAVTTQDRKVPVVAGGKIAALVPQSLEEAFRVSQAIAASGLAPKGLDRPEQVMVAIMAGAELGLAPFQALQSFAVVNGRPTLWGDGLMAVARAGGVRVKEWTEGEGDDMVAHCEVTRESGEVITRTFSVAQAKKASLWGKAGPWQSYPQRMLGMRARAYALRDGCADMLRGFQVREEVEDYEPIRDVTPRATTGMRARLEARTPTGGFDPEHITAALDEALEGDRLPEEPQTAEFTEAHEQPPQVDAEQQYEDTFPGDAPPRADPEDFDPVSWSREQTNLLDDAGSVKALDEIASAGFVQFQLLQKDSPTLAAALEAKMKGKRKALADKERSR